MNKNQLLRYIKKNNYLNILLSLYLLFSISTYSIWQAKNHNNITGDEPHYLVMTNGISKYQSFKQTKPYQEEFSTSEIYGDPPKIKVPTNEDYRGNVSTMGPRACYLGIEVPKEQLIWQDPIDKPKYKLKSKDIRDLK